MSRVSENNSLTLSLASLFLLPLFVEASILKYFNVTITIFCDLINKGNDQHFLKLNKFSKSDTLVGKSFKQATSFKIKVGLSPSKKNLFFA